MTIQEDRPDLLETGFGSWSLIPEELETDSESTLYDNWSTHW